MYSAEWQLMQLACAFAKPGRALGRSCAPSGGRVIDLVVAKTKAVPSPSTAAMAVERRMLVCMAVFLASDRSDLDRLDHVAHVAGRLPDRRRRLADAGACPGAGADVVGAGAIRRQREGEFAERVAPQVFAEEGVLPGFAAVGRDTDLADALAAVEGDAANDGRAARGDTLAILQRRDERANREAADRPCRRRRGAGHDADAIVVGDAVGRLHPEAVELLVDDLDLRQVLDPVRAVVARHDAVSYTHLRAHET